MDNKNSKDDDSSNNRDTDMYLKHLNKLSHKISKPIRKSSSSSSSTVHFLPTQSQPSTHQPPVYNIDKSDFRDVVQRLTGSAVHDRFDGLTRPFRPVQDRFERLGTLPVAQPVAQMPKPASSRLQRIRPPPLPEIGNRGPGSLTGVRVSEGVAREVNFGQRQPFSPLPPFPSVHATAESPISAYMRFYQSSVLLNASSSSQQLSSALGAMPRGGSPVPMPMPPQSPLPFGCLSPGGVSGGLMFSPSLGFSQLPLSPTLPVSSPSQKGH